MPHPAGLPDLFLDRSLGRIQVPTLLREAGLRLVTLAERYGVPEDEGIADETWLADAGQRGESSSSKTFGCGTTQPKRTPYGATPSGASASRARI